MGFLKNWMGAAVKGHMIRSIDFAESQGVPRDFSSLIVQEVTQLKHALKFIREQVPEIKEKDVYKQNGFALKMLYERYLKENGEEAEEVEQVTAKFVNHGISTVIDTETGLMWQKGETGIKTWEEALFYCEDLESAGYNDWRLPDCNELKSIMDLNYNEPCINTTIFPDAKPSSYWSSDTDADVPDHKIFMRYVGYRGYDGSTHKSQNCYVRAVRNNI